VNPLTRELARAFSVPKQHEGHSGWVYSEYEAKRYAGLVKGGGILLSVQSDNLGSNNLGQNIEPQGLSSHEPIAAYTAFALAMVCLFFVLCARTEVTWACELRHKNAREKRVKRPVSPRVFQKIVDRVAKNVVNEISIARENCEMDSETAKWPEGTERSCLSECRSADVKSM